MNKKRAVAIREILSAAALLFIANFFGISYRQETGEPCQVIKREGRFVIDPAIDLSRAICPKKTTKKPQICRFTSILLKIKNVFAKLIIRSRVLHILNKHEEVKN